VCRASTVLSAVESAVTLVHGALIRRSSSGPSTASGRFHLGLRKFGHQHARGRSRDPGPSRNRPTLAPDQHHGTASSADPSLAESGVGVLREETSPSDACRLRSSIAVTPKRPKPIPCFPRPVHPQAMDPPADPYLGSRWELSPLENRRYRGSDWAQAGARQRIPFKRMPRHVTGPASRRAVTAAKLVLCSSHASVGHLEC